MPACSRSKARPGASRTTSRSSPIRTNTPRSRRHSRLRFRTASSLSYLRFFAYGMRRGIWMERTITTILVLPISLGVIFLSEGILGFYGTNGWLNQMLLGADIIKGAARAHA